MNPVHEILAPPVDRIARLQNVFAILRHFETKHRIRIEAEIIAVGQLAALRIAHGHHHLEPPGHGIREIGNQCARLPFHDQALPAPGLEAEDIDIAGLDLPVERAGHAGCRLIRSALLIRFALADFRESADFETQRSGQTGGTTETQLAHARLGVRGYLDLDAQHLAELRVRLHPVAALHDRLPVTDFRQAHGS